MSAAIVLAVLFSAFSVCSAFAAGNIHFGRLQVEPGIDYKLKYDDNIYKENTNEEEDFIHFFTPSVRLSYAGNPGNYFNAGYSADLVAYSDFDDNNYTSHKPYVAFGYKSPAGFYIQGADNFLYTKDPYGSRNQYNIGVNTERWNNNANVTLGYEFADRYSVEVLYKNYIERYDLVQDEWQDRTDNVYGLSFIYKLTPKTAVFGQIRRTDAEYDNQNDGVTGGGATWTSATSQDYALNDFFIGARFEPGGKLSGEFKIGYGEKDFDNETSPLFANRPYEDESTWIAESSINYQMYERTGIALTLNRGHLGSPDADAASYIDTLVGIHLTQGLQNRLALLVGFDWITNDYQNIVAGRPDKFFNIYNAGIGIEWAARDWLKAGVEYKLESKQATEDAYASQEYDDNSVTFRVSALF